MTMMASKEAAMDYDEIVREIDRAARAAVGYITRGGPGNYEEWTDLAWMAIAEGALEAEYQNQADWKWIGVQGIRAELTAHRRHHGVGDPKAMRDPGTKGPAYARYWFDAASSEPDFAEGVAESLALRQVLEILTPKERVGLAALAEFGDWSAAAEAVGISQSALRDRIRSARRKILPLWGAPGESPRETDLTTHCRKGHERAKHGYRQGPTGPWRCRMCRRAWERQRWYDNRASAYNED